MLDSVINVPNNLRLCGLARIGAILLCTLSISALMMRQKTISKTVNPIIPSFLLRKFCWRFLKVVHTRMRQGSWHIAGDPSSILVQFPT